MAAILDLFFIKNLKVTKSFRHEFSIKNHVKIRYYIRIYGNNSGITTSTWLHGHFEFYQKKDVPLRGNFGTFVQVLTEEILVIYRFKRLYVSQIRMTIDLLSVKIQKAAILDFF